MAVPLGDNNPPVRTFFSYLQNWGEGGAASVWTKFGKELSTVQKCIDGPTADRHTDRHTCRHTAGFTIHFVRSVRMRPNNKEGLV